jgi:hypothetical protein
MAFEPRLGDDYQSRDSITGKIDKTGIENPSYKVVSFSSLASASAIISEEGRIFYDKNENTFYGIVGEGDSTIAKAL